MAVTETIWRGKVRVYCSPTWWGGCVSEVDYWYSEYTAVDRLRDDGIIGHKSSKHWDIINSARLAEVTARGPSSVGRAGGRHAHSHANERLPTLGVGRRHTHTWVDYRHQEIPARTSNRKLSASDTLTNAFGVYCSRRRLSDNFCRQRPPERHDLTDIKNIMRTGSCANENDLMSFILWFQT